MFLGLRANARLCEHGVSMMELPAPVDLLTHSVADGEERGMSAVAARVSSAARWNVLFHLIPASTSPVLAGPPIALMAPLRLKPTGPMSANRSLLGHHGRPARAVERAPAASRSAPLGRSLGVTMPWGCPGGGVRETPRAGPLHHGRPESIPARRAAWRSTNPRGSASD